MTKSDNSEIAVLQTKMETVLEEVKEIRQALSKIQSAIDDKFVAKEEFKEELTRLEGEFAKYKRSQAWQKVALALLTAAVTFLVVFFLDNVGI